MNTVPINIVGPSYESRSLPLSAQRTLNLYPEVNPNTTALHCWPGAKAFSTGSGKNRGIAEWGGVLYAVNGTTLYSVSSTGTQTSIGSVAGSDRCIFAADANYLYFTTENKAYRTDGSTVEVCSDTDLSNPTSIAFLKGFFFYSGGDQYWSASLPGDGFNISALDKGQAEAVYDDLMRMYVFNDQLYMFSSKSYELWYVNGQIEPPISKFEGGTKHIGLGATHGIANTERAVYFLGHDRAIYRASGYESEQISKIAINNAIENYANVTDCYAWSVKFQGQNFVLFSFPSEGKTWGYSEPFNEWFELSTYLGRYLANDYAYCYGKRLISDYSNGNIYELDIDTFTDNSQTVIRERVLPALTAEPLGAPSQRLIASRMELILERGIGLATGQGSAPVVMISVSEDGGKTFGKETFVDPGVMGAYKTKVEWYGFATGYELVFKVRVSDPVTFSVTGAAADIQLAGY